MTSSSEFPMSPARLSDAQRDRVLGVLREGAAQGKLSHDTFMRRMELALAARRPEELAVLTSDLDGGGRWSQGLVRAVGGISAFPGRLRRAWQTERLPRLLLPVPGPYPLLIGRDPANGLRLNHETVSRLHAELHALNGRWLLRDLGSTNGTCVNGQRLVGSIPVRDGDQVSFGHMSFRLTAPSHRPLEPLPPPAPRPSADGRPGLPGPPAPELSSRAPEGPRQGAVPPSPSSDRAYPGPGRPAHSPTLPPRGPGGTPPGAVPPPHASFEAPPPGAEVPPPGGGAPSSGAEVPPPGVGAPPPGAGVPPPGAEAPQPGPPPPPRA
ncbi:FHA domain-containing protein [Streptomyces sp. NPDC017448]|uniref:FHA domain-containing protein n=1 Tax=Streptomyces sp. NPDC017448 TaxID=3364996 RepID=UPI00379AFA91